MEEIKSTIDANITPNGEQGITGSVLNRVLNDMVDATEGKLAQLDQDVKTTKLVDTAEAGFFIVDSQLNIGFAVTEQGIQGIGLPSFINI